MAFDIFTCPGSYVSFLPGNNAGSSGFGFFSALKSTNAIAKMRPKVDRPGEDNKIILVIDDEHTDW